MAVPTSVYPSGLYTRTIKDYLFDLDPSGDHSRAFGDSRQQSISSDVSSNFVRNIRIIAQKHPIWLAGLGYNITGEVEDSILQNHAFHLKPATGHPVFQDNTTVLSQFGGGLQLFGGGLYPLDVRYDEVRNVWTFPNSLFPGIVVGIASGNYHFGNNGEIIESPGLNQYRIKVGNKFFGARLTGSTTAKEVKHMILGQAVLTHFQVLDDNIHTDLTPPLVYVGVQ